MPNGLRFINALDTHDEDTIWILHIMWFIRNAMTASQVDKWYSLIHDKSFFFFYLFHLLVDPYCEYQYQLCHVEMYEMLMRWWHIQWFMWFMCGVGNMRLSFKIWFLISWTQPDSSCLVHFYCSQSYTAQSQWFPSTVPIWGGGALVL